MIFRRKAAKDQAAKEEAETIAEVDALAELDTNRPHGPWDRSETTADEGDGSYVDLGGIIVKGAPGLELRLQVDESQSTVSAVLLAGPESGLELRAFAAPRREGIWDDVRTDIAAEAVKRGGTATELDGEYGTELKVVVPAKAPDGREATQTSRIVGVEGPRWLLRGTFLGKSASTPDPDGVVESAFRAAIVVRGAGPMAPRQLIRMEMPEQAVAATQGDETAGDGADVPDDPTA